MSFRKEKKYRLTSSDSCIVKNNLFENGMYELFPKRKITSQYFDTPSLRMFDESEEGIVPRKKVRIRWYNNTKEKFTLEKKISSVEGRFKQTKMIGPEKYNSLIKEGIFDSDYGLIKPSLLVEYTREYYIFNGIRFTFDKNIIYQLFNKKIKCADNETVMEIKSPFITEDGFLEKIFP